MATASRYFTIKQFCEEIGIAESAFHDWRIKGLAPRCIKLPNRQIRIRCSDVDAWLESREESGVAA
ncbi:helix-turn-helix domain-containing protein [Amycolatopsis sp. RM579]|uniref:Helix-turn-helix domain-containing protein n=2 Tax=Amycolatopsis pithecellobii TaxID=664692 RepID=A0A6N7ZDE8_9PSEU|nr:helix-turn-helix domain-containing protein [Amycolatopsis pithecellobii]